MQSIDFKQVHALRATLIAGGAGATGGAVAFAATGAWASASTGTAIATLHGVAATNATLAFLGGGSLATGGLGMAGGVAVLGGLVAVPALVVGGLFLDRKASRDLRLAEADAKIVSKFFEESDRAIAVLEEIRSVAFGLKNVLFELDRRFVPMIVALRDLIDQHTFGNLFKRIYYSLKRFALRMLNRWRIMPPAWFVKEAKISVLGLTRNEQNQIKRTITVAQVIKTILDADLTDDSGLVPTSAREILDLAIRYQGKIDRTKSEDR